MTELFAACARRSLLPGEALFRQGDPAGSVFLIEQGGLRMVRHLASGEAVTISKGRAGELFAEGALFSAAYHCDALASEPTVVAACAKGDMLAAIQASPGLGLKLLRRVTQQLHAARTLLELRNVRSAEERVLQHLRLHADGLGAATFSRPLLENAADLGLTQEAYYRALAALAQAGTIAREGRRIRLAQTPPYRGA